MSNNTQYRGIDNPNGYETFHFNDGATLYVNYGTEGNMYVNGNHNVRIWANENTNPYNRYCDLTFKTDANYANISLVRRVWQEGQASSDDYIFTMNAITSSSTNLAFRYAVGNNFQGSTYAPQNIPMNVNGEEVYTANTTHNAWSNSTTNHTFSITASKDDFLSDYGLLWNCYSNYPLLTSVDIQSNLPLVQLNYAFNNCKNLTSFNSSALNVGNLYQCFRYCYNLSDISGLQNWNVENVNSMAYTFANCNNLSKISFPNATFGNLTNMADAFYWCNNLSEISFPNATFENVTDMSYAFYYCYNLSEISFPNATFENLTNMYSAFYHCYNLSEISFPNATFENLTNMTNAFEYCNNLSEISFPNATFENLTDMYRAFANCYNLSKIAFPNATFENLTNMYSAFYRCYNLSDIAFPNATFENVTNMADAFAYCYNLSEISFPNATFENVTDMTYAFYQCNNLSEISFPNATFENVTNMANAFEYCYNLSEIPFPANATFGNLTNISRTFYLCNNATGNLYLRGNNITCAANFFNKANTYQVNVFAYNGTNTWNSLYRALGSTTYNSSWNVYLYEL